MASTSNKDVASATSAAAKHGSISPARILAEDKLKSFGVGDTERVLSVAFHPVKQYIAFGCENSSIKLWNIRSKLYAGIFTHHGSVNALEFSSDGNVLATAASGHAEGNTIALWQCVHELKNEDELNLRLYMHDTELSPFRAEVLHQGTINALAFGPSLGKYGGTTLASASDDATVRVWQYPPKHKMSRQTLRSHKTKVTSCVFSEDGRYLISASIDGVICVHRLDLNDSADDGHHVAASTIGTTTAGGDADGQDKGASGGDASDGEDGGSGDASTAAANTGSSGAVSSSGTASASTSTTMAVASGAPPQSSMMDDAQNGDKKDGTELEVVPDLIFTHIYRFSCMEPVLNLRFFPDFQFTTLIGTSVKVNGPDREYLLCAGGTKSLMILRLRDGYLATDPNGKAPEALEDLANIERLTTPYAGDREVSYSTRRVNYSQMMLQQRIPMPDAVRSVACQRLSLAGIDDVTEVDASLRTHSGYLEIKRAQRRLIQGAWKRQYFVPNMDQGEISWYKNEQLGDVPKGFLRFDSLRSVSPMSRKRDPEGRQFRVYLYGSREPIILRAASREERRTWIRVFDAGMSSIKPSVYIVNACSGPHLFSFVIQSTFAPSARPQTSQFIAESLVRQLHTYMVEEIGEHDDYITALAAPDDAIRARFLESHILENSQYMCVSASADQSVRAFVWTLINPRGRKHDASAEADGPENDQDDEEHPRLNFQIMSNFGKPWITLERPLTQQQLNSVVEQATEQATSAMMRVEVTNSKPVTLGFPSKPDIGRLGLVKIEGIHLDSDDEEFVDNSDDSGDVVGETDETSVMASMGTDLLGPAAPLEGADLLVAAQVLQGPKRFTAAESVIHKAEARREFEESNLSPEDALREQQRIADHKSLGQLRSYARMLARQELERSQVAEAAGRESCNTDGCTIA